jgi:threonyl-tRNA synthetase
VKEVEEGSTSADIARSIGEGLLRASIAAKVDGDVVDLHLPINISTNVEIITSNNPEAQEILLHSSAHLLAQAVKALYPHAKIAIGPALVDRFYYDIDVDVTMNEEELRKIEKKMVELSHENLQVQRVELSRNDALEKFKEMDEDYKVEIISEIDAKETISVYQQGNFIDLCRGPHVPSTGKIKHFKLLNSAGAYWRGDEKNKMLQRIYGTAWYTKKELDDFLYRMEGQAPPHRQL